MGIEEILKKNDEEHAKSVRHMKQQIDTANSRFVAFEQRVTDEILHAIRSLMDPGMGTAKRIPSDPGNERLARVLCTGGVAQFSLTSKISMLPGSEEPTCSEIQIIGARNGKRSEESFYPSTRTAAKLSQIPESSFYIDQDRFKATIDNLATRL